MTTEPKQTALVKEQPLTTTFPLVANPTLLKVQTISLKIAEQLDWLGGQSGDFEYDLTGIEVVGVSAKNGAVIVRRANGSLARVVCNIFSTYLVKKFGKTYEEAHAEMDTFPQLFEV